MLKILTDLAAKFLKLINIFCLHKIMAYEKKIENLALSLFDIDAVKFGEFTTKTGLKTPIYFDLRVIVSYPDVMDTISLLLYEFAIKDNKSDHLCGVPYTALPIATLLSVKSKKPMLMRRKESKSYGTKKMIEGHYKQGDTCLIIEDVVTSGSSVLETINDLRKEGLRAEEAIVILDREQTGRKNLENNNVKLRSLFTMTQLLKILVANDKITEKMSDDVKAFLQNVQAPVIAPSVQRTLIPYEKRAEQATNSIAKKLFKIMAVKRTNLCLSADLTSCVQILDLVENVGEYICLLKTHIDIIEDFTPDFTKKIKQLAAKYNFLILEDRKYADIGHTVALQHTKGLYRINEWADCVTAHSLPGEGILKALNDQENERGVFLLAEMSSEGNLITPDYTEATTKMAAKYPNLLSGFVCQKGATFTDPGLIQLTPGVQLENSKDDLGQVYSTPEKVILENGADVIVVGRGIVKAKNPKNQAIIYKDSLWQCYEKRISNIQEFV